MPMYRALESFPFGKHRLMAGEAFEADEKIGNVLVKVRKAEATKLDTPAEVQTMTAPAKREEAVAQPAAPLYATRHMEAEKPENKPRRGRPRGTARQPQS